MKTTGHKKGTEKEKVRTAYLLAKGRCFFPHPSKGTRIPPGID